jgi:hypothetical protein
MATCIASGRKVSSFWEDRGDPIQCPECGATIPFAAFEAGDWDSLPLPIHAAGREYSAADCI